MTYTTQPSDFKAATVVVLDGPIDTRLPGRHQVDHRVSLDHSDAGIGLNVAFAAARAGGAAGAITALGRVQGADLRRVVDRGTDGDVAHGEIVRAFNDGNRQGFARWAEATPVAVSAGPVNGRQEIQLADALVVTLNAPLRAIEEAVSIAVAANTAVWVYASPNRYSAADLRSIPWERVDAVVANEPAARQLARLTTSDGPLVTKLKGLSPNLKLACVTNGAEGSHVAVGDEIAYASPSTPQELEGFRADAFVGTLVSGLRAAQLTSIDAVRPNAVAASVVGGCVTESSAPELATDSAIRYANPSVRLVPNGRSLASAPAGIGIA